MGNVGKAAVVVVGIDAEFEDKPDNVVVVVAMPLCPIVVVEIVADCQLGHCELMNSQWPMVLNGEMIDAVVVVVVRRFVVVGLVQPCNVPVDDNTKNDGN